MAIFTVLAVKLLKNYWNVSEISLSRHEKFTASVKYFIDNYAQREGLSLPGRVPGDKSFRIKLLPTSTTRAELWRSYKHAAKVRGYQSWGTQNLYKHGMTSFPS